MIITALQYLEPVYRGKSRGTNFEYVYLTAREISPTERNTLEIIAKRWTYILGFLGNHKQSEDGTHYRYRGIRNKVRFVEKEGITYIYIQGPYATEIGF